MARRPSSRRPARHRPWPRSVSAWASPAPASTSTTRPASNSWLRSWPISSPPVGIGSSAIVSAHRPNRDSRSGGYICANVELFVGSEQAVANALVRIVDPSVLQEPMQRFHRELQEPLVEALTAHGEPRPLEVAQLIDSMIVQACRSLGAEHSENPPRTPSTANGSEITEMIRRLIGGYLGLPDDRPGSVQRKA